MKHDETNRAYFYLWKLNSPFAIITSVIIFREIWWFNYTRCSSQTTTTQICMIIQITNIHHGRSISTCQNHQRNFEQLSKQVYTLFSRNCFHELKIKFISRNFNHFLRRFKHFGESDQILWWKSKIKMIMHGNEPCIIS